MENILLHKGMYIDLCEKKDKTFFVGHFKAISASCIYIFNKKEVQTFIFRCLLSLNLNPKTRGIFGSIFFVEMKFALSNFLSNENLSISYES